MGRVLPNYRSRTTFVVAAVFVSALTVVVLYTSSSSFNPLSHSVGSLETERASLIRATHLAAAYLANQVQRNGSFRYRVNMNTERRLKAKYNFLRHAGSIYAMVDYLARYPDAEMLALTRATADYLAKIAIKPLDEEHDIWAVWSDPKHTGSSKDRLEAKLGGAGLALLALTRLRQLDPDAVPIDVLRHLAHFILYMQKPDGSFYSKYVPVEGGRSDSWTSLYYPGEAALGLVTLYHVDPRDEWLHASAAALAYLARLRQGRGADVAADHWALIATGQVLPHLQRLTAPVVDRLALTTHADQIVQRMLEEFYAVPKHSPAYGGFVDDGRTTATSIRLEGLLAAMRYLPHRKTEIEVVVRQGIAFLLNAQVHETDFLGGVPRAVAELPANETKEDKKFNKRVTEIRIDYVQHALSAFLDADQMLFGP